MAARDATPAETALFERIEPHVSAQGADLVDVSLFPGPGGTTVRIVIHSADGVTIGDCTRVTRALGGALDEAPELAGRYVLEVTSPGTDRVLRAPREFEVFRGARVQLRLEQPGEEGGTGERELVGVAAGTSGESVVVRREDGRETVIPWSRVAKARLNPEKLGRGSGGKEQ
jgi:ribosome maturation factor RimP